MQDLSEFNEIPAYEIDELTENFVNRCETVDFFIYDITRTVPDV